MHNVFRTLAHPSESSLSIFVSLGHFGKKKEKRKKSAYFYFPPETVCPECFPESLPISLVACLFNAFE